MSKKVDISFMRMVVNQEDWDREVIGAGDMLCIIDVYDSLWGPAEMMASHLSNYYFELGEKYSMKFVRAQCNKIKVLEEFKERSKPMFLTYMVGAAASRALLRPPRAPHRPLATPRATSCTPCERSLARPRRALRLSLSRPALARCTRAQNGAEVGRLDGADLPGIKDEIVTKANAIKAS